MGRPGATGGIPGPYPQFTACAPSNESCPPPSEGCAPKKVTGSVPLECVRGLRPPKYRSFAEYRAYLAKKTFFFIWSLPQNLWNFAMKTFWFLVYTLEFEEIEFFEPPQIVYAPQSPYSGAGPVYRIKTMP